MSLVVTTLNEAKSLADLIEDICCLHASPYDVVFVDAGSQDGTVEILERARKRFKGCGIELKIAVRQGANIAQGRNHGIEMAAEDVIAITDAGCRLDPEWYGRLIAPIREGEAEFVGGFFKAEACGRFQKVLACLTTTNIPPDGFVPSSRSVAFSRDLWRRVEGYPEKLRWGEDTLFSQICIEKAQGYRIVSDAIVHWKVRENAYEVVRQFYRYALGDGEAGAIRASMAVNQSVGWVAICMAVLGYLPLCCLLGFCYLMTVVARKRRCLRINDYPMAIGIAGIIQISRFCGFLHGLCRRVIKGIAW